VRTKDSAAPAAHRSANSHVGACRLGRRPRARRASTVCSIAAPPAASLGAKPPYDMCRPSFALRIFPTTAFTVGGIRVDQNARVVDPPGQPIDGQHAAGESSVAATQGPGDVGSSRRCASPTIQNMDLVDSSIAKTAIGPRR
jgi:predicted oxidoreductase